MLDGEKKRGRYGAGKARKDRISVKSSPVAVISTATGSLGAKKTQKCVCEQVSRATKGHNRQSDIRFPTESLFSEEVGCG